VRWLRFSAAFFSESQFPAASCGSMKDRGGRTLLLMLSGEQETPSDP
jgi:hypothetical protein